MPFTHHKLEFDSSSASNSLYLLNACSDLGYINQTGLHTLFISEISIQFK